MAWSGGLRTAGGKADARCQEPTRTWTGSSEPLSTSQTHGPGGAQRSSSRSWGKASKKAPGRGSGSGAEGRWPSVGGAARVVEQDEDGRARGCGPNPAFPTSLRCRSRGGSRAGAPPRGGALRCLHWRTSGRVPGRTEAQMPDFEIRRSSDGQGDWNLFRAYASRHLHDTAGRPAQGAVQRRRLKAGRFRSGRSTAGADVVLAVEQPSRRSWGGRTPKTLHAGSRTGGGMKVDGRSWTPPTRTWQALGPRSGRHPSGDEF